MGEWCILGLSIASGFPVYQRPICFLQLYTLDIPHICQGGSNLIFAQSYVTGLAYVGGSGTQSLKVLIYSFFVNQHVSVA